MPSSGRPLSKGEIIESLRKLSDRLATRGIRGEICLLGGAAMALSFHARESTMDVDAMVRPSHEVILEANLMSGGELPPGWLNNAVEIFLSPTQDLPLKSLCLQFPNLAVYSPPAEYLLAMKVRASRMGTSFQSGDSGDIKHLLAHMGITDPDDAWERVSKYYPPDVFAPHARILLTEICASLPKNKLLHEPTPPHTP